MAAGRKSPPERLGPPAGGVHESAAGLPHRAALRSRAGQQAAGAPADQADPDLEALRARLALLEQSLELQQRAATEGARRLASALNELGHERRRLRLYEERLHSLLESALDAVVCFDSNGVVIEWNPRAELILGWSSEQALGQTAQSLQFPVPLRGRCEHDSPGRQAWSEPILVGERVELTAVHRDGWEFPVEMAVSRIGSGPDTIFSVCLRDITDRKEDQQDLAEARDGALAASRMKSEFLATMSHEVRTPMNGVVGMTELLLSTELTPEQREYAQAIQGSADVLLAILNDILDLSKIEADHITLDSVPFDLRHIVEEIGDLLTPAAAQAGLELTVHYPADSPAGFRGDPARVRQILVNLVGNAIKFTLRGHVSIDVRGRQLTGTTAEISIVVEDTGIGIAPGKLPHIFDKFVQGDSSMTRKHGGTGLGLAITRKLVEMMNGTLRAESTPGQGSRFFVTLTLALEPQAASPTGPDVSLEGLRVLFVGPDDVHRHVVCDHVLRHGVNVHAVGEGKEALLELRNAHHDGRPFEVAILDRQMPGMDGEAVALEIKADPTLARTALVLVTSVAEHGEAARMLLSGFTDVLIKPVRQRQLLRSLARARACGPAAPASSHTTRPAHRPAPPIEGAPAPKPCRARILVAEDSPVNQKVVTHMLEKLDCAVDLAADGKQAVTMAAAAAYDLIFMDCQMPEMDGFEATAEIRRGQPGGHTPIVALTANAMPGDRERCLQAGMDDYLAKPIKVSDLASALQRWLPVAAKTSGQDHGLRQRKLTDAAARLRQPRDQANTGTATRPAAFPKPRSRSRSG